MSDRRLTWQRLESRLADPDVTLDEVLGLLHAVPRLKLSCPGKPPVALMCIRVNFLIRAATGRIFPPELDREAKVINLANRLLGEMVIRWVSDHRWSVPEPHSDLKTLYRDLVIYYQDPGRKYLGSFKASGQLLDALGGLWRVAHHPVLDVMPAWRDIMLINRTHPQVLFLRHLVRVVPTLHEILAKRLLEEDESLPRLFWNWRQIPTASGEGHHLTHEQAQTLAATLRSSVDVREDLLQRDCTEIARVAGRAVLSGHTEHLAHALLGLMAQGVYFVRAVQAGDWLPEEPFYRMPPHHGG